ncbi:XK-related protein 7-like isoform X1 [Dermacentor albipictus]|uniref:XK-related protein 7-like isoform X1 n=2 Tax=Dermacentor albipictus TaxID=60249 RepID=UPI0031FC10AD
MTARVLNEIFFKNFVYVCSVSTPEDKKGPRFTKLDVFFTFLSIITFFSDIATDVIVVTQYALYQLWVYAGMTLFFVLMPSLVVNVCSFRWHIHDKRVSKVIWVASVLQLGVLHRYWLCLRAGLKAERTRDVDDFHELYQHQSDLCMLRLFDSFLESAPQLVLQLYIMVNHEDWNPWTGISALLSLLSLGWGIAAYGKAMRLYRAEKQQLSWTGLILQTLWRFGTMTSRVTSMVLLACVCGAWTLVIIGTHWMLMTGWLVWQKTDFCPSRWEELVYNAVVGAIYTFCFFNVREGRSRGRVFAFYALIGLQNVAFLTVYCVAKGDADDLRVITSTAVVLGSFGIGMYCMALYYRFFHPSGPIYLCTGKSAQGGSLEMQEHGHTPGDASTPPSKSKPSSAAVSASHSFRTLKYANCAHQTASTPRQQDSERASSLSGDSTISPCSQDTPKSMRLFDKATPEERQTGKMDASDLYHNRTAMSLSGDATSPVPSRRVRFDFKDCSLDESHRWRSEDCSFADIRSDSDDVETLSITKDRLASHHHVVNYNFRPFVGEGAHGHPFRRHCSCLVLFECLPDLGFESLLLSMDSKVSAKKALLNVMSTPNVRLQHLNEESCSDSAASWSMHNFLAADQSVVGFSESAANGSTEVLV